MRDFGFVCFIVYKLSVSNLRIGMAEFGDIDLDLLAISQVGLFDMVNNEEFWSDNMFVPEAVSETVNESEKPQAQEFNPQNGPKCCTITSPPNQSNECPEMLTAVPLPDENDPDSFNPGQLSDNTRDTTAENGSTEHLRQPTYVSVTDDDKENFLDQMKNKNTVRKTESSLKQFQR